MTRDPHSVEVAIYFTIRGLVSGRIYKATTRTGEILTVGPDIPAVGTPGYAIHGYHRGGFRTELFDSPRAAAARLVELTDPAKETPTDVLQDHIPRP